MLWLLDFAGKCIISVLILDSRRTVTVASYYTGQCKRTGGCYYELVVAFYSTGGGVKGEKIYTC